MVSLVGIFTSKNCVSKEKPVFVMILPTNSDCFHTSQIYCKQVTLLSGG